MTRLRWIALVAAAASLLVGCGDDGGDDDASASSSGSASASSEAAAEDDTSSDDAQATVDAAVAAFEAELEAAGFTETADDGAAGGEEEEDDSFDFESEECQAFEEAFPDEGDEFPGADAEAESGSWERSDDASFSFMSAEGFAAYASDQEAMDEVFDMFDDDRFGDCMEEAFRASFEESMAEDPEAPEIELEMDIRQIDPPDGLDGFGIQFVGSMGAMGLSFDIDGQIMMVRRDERAAMAVLIGIGDASDLEVVSLVETLLG
ncbi:MAG TPA: hypothetical protein VEA78_05250 [Acidimicrobiales bacterium]|nr:hypothetical protein [Acidimicrobiales bacterium]